MKSKMQRNMNINEKILILILILIITLLISYFNSSFNIIEGISYKIDNKKAGNQIKKNAEQEKKEKEPGIRANENKYANMHDKAFI